MIHEKGHYRRYYQPGPGGWECSCCAPAPGKFRKRLLKGVEHSGRMAWKIELREELKEISEERGSKL